MMRSFAPLVMMMASALASAGPAQSPAAVTPIDPRGNPESLAVAADGSVYMGSQTAPVVYRARPGSTRAEPFIDMRAGGSAFVLGVLAEPATTTLWVCEVITMDRSTPLLRPTSALNAFDMVSGARKARLLLPGEHNLCNDMSVAPDGSLFVADTVNSRILRLTPGGQSFQTVLQHPSLFGVDGITFLNGQLFVTTIWSSNIYRIPMDSGGKAGAPIDIELSRPLRGPDGMRAANGRLYVAEGAGGRVDALTVTNDRAEVTTIRDGFAAPTAVEPINGMLWVADRAGNKVVPVPLN